MKKLIISLVAITTISLSSLSQAPEAFKYQAVIRDGSSLILTNQAVGMQLIIRQGSVGGTPVYTETFAPTTNGYGLVNLEIGTGTTVDDFTTIDWGNGPYFMETAVDVTGGVAYLVMGTSQLVSVPYALHAKTADNVLNDAVDDADADPTNEIQAVSFTNDTLYLSNGGQVYLGAYGIDLVDDADNDPTNEIDTWGTLAGIPADILDGDDVDDADADPTNELQAVSMSNDTLYLSDGGQVYLGAYNLQRDVSIGGGIAPLAGYPTDPVDGYRRDVIIAENPNDPRESNFVVDVAHSAAGYGINMGSGNTLPNDGTVQGSVISGGESNSIGAVFSTISGGFNNTTSTFDFATIGGGQNNSITNGSHGTVGGGDTNVAGSWATVAGGRSNTAGFQYSTVGGGQNNTAGGVLGSGQTVSGGIGNTASNLQSSVGGGNGNTASGSSSTIAGGRNNVASATDATIGGGLENQASGLSSFIGAGQKNIASGVGSVVCGGKDYPGNATNNQATGDLTFIGGGRYNIASGFQTTIGGGLQNVASFPYATIPGGYGAQVNSYGQFVHANGRLGAAVNGSAQVSEYILRGSSNLAPGVQLSLDGGAVVATINTINIPVNSTWAWEVTLVAREDTGSPAGGYYTEKNCGLLTRDATGAIIVFPSTSSCYSAGGAIVLPSGSTAVSIGGNPATPYLNVALFFASGQWSAVATVKTTELKIQ